jgi:hypothetical protein
VDLTADFNAEIEVRAITPILSFEQMGSDRPDMDLCTFSASPAFELFPVGNPSAVVTAVVGWLSVATAKTPASIGEQFKHCAEILPSGFELRVCKVVGWSC